MVTALGISLVAIFLTLLIQFKKLSETLIVMSSIPLALPGAVLGLVITHNPFGFTAFMGMISPLRDRGAKRDHSRRLH